MHLFKLTPNPTNWPKQNYKSDVVIIRAPSKHEAMKLVKLATFTTQPKTPIGKRIPNPWIDRSYATLEAYVGDDFSAEGKEEILAPAWMRDYFLSLK